MKILLLANHDYTIYGFRSELVQELLRAGHEVHTSCPVGDHATFFEELGCIVHDVQLSQHGMNPIEDLKLVKQYQCLLKDTKPDVVLSYTIKPNIYGGMACAKCKTPQIATITGLGSAFEKGKIVSAITFLLYRFGMRKTNYVLFQNQSQQELFASKKIASGRHRLISGSGVDLTKHMFEEYPAESNELTLLFIGRLMKDKGIEELTEAAKRLRRKQFPVRFVVVGKCEKDYQAELEKLNMDNVVERVGYQSDVRPFIKQAHAVVLPSYHEGMANVLLEAAACGRPILASDIPGCRETFDEGVSGFGFKPRDVNSLCETIEKFIALPYEKKAEMGRAGRVKMEKEFDRQIVVNKYMELIRKIEGEK